MIVGTQIGFDCIITTHAHSPIVSCVNYRKTTKTVVMYPFSATTIKLCIKQDSSCDEVITCKKYWRFLSFLSNSFPPFHCVLAFWRYITERFPPKSCVHDLTCFLVFDVSGNLNTFKLWPFRPVSSGNGKAEAYMLRKMH